MKASLRLEAIGDDAAVQSRIGAAYASAAGYSPNLFRIPARQWCAEITGRDPAYRWARRFLQGRKDYSGSNGIGSRGVYVYYDLESGHIYEVKAPLSWSRSDRYFCIVEEDGTISRMTEQELEDWF